MIDPCALVAAAAPSTQPRATPAPWSLPAFALSRIGYAGLTPLVGAVIRHDHVHLDVIVDGRHVAVPAGIGIAEPVNTGHGFFGRVANSPLHTQVYVDGRRHPGDPRRIVLGNRQEIAVVFGSGRSRRCRPRRRCTWPP